MLEAYGVHYRVCGRLLTGAASAGKFRKTVQGTAASGCRAVRVPLGTNGGAASLRPGPPIWTEAWRWLTVAILGEWRSSAPTVGADSLTATTGDSAICPAQDVGGRGMRRLWQVAT